MLWYTHFSWALDLHREMQNVSLALECHVITIRINGHAGEENRFTVMLVISGKTWNSYSGFVLVARHTWYYLPCPNRN